MRQNHIYCILIIILMVTSCQKKRSLYPDKLLGGMEKLSENHTGVKFNNTIEENKSENLFFVMHMYNGAGVAIGDINNDGLADIYFCGNQVNDKLYLNQGNFKFKDISETAGIDKIPGWSTGVTMADVNADGLLDIYVSRSGTSNNLKDRQNLLYINNGDNTFVESSKKYGLANYGFSTQAIFFDYDNDNDLDMFLVNQPPDPKIVMKVGVSKDKFNYYRDVLYRNDNGRFKNISKSAGITKISYGLSVSAADFDNNGFVDLYVANDYDNPDLLYMNNGDGTFTNRANENLKHMSKFSMGSDANDINNDGFIDLSTLDMVPDDHYRSKTMMKSMNSEKFYNGVTNGWHYQYMTNTLQLNHGNAKFSDIGFLAGVAKTDWSWATLIADFDNDGWKDIIVTNGIKRDITNIDFQSETYSDINSGNSNYLEMTKIAPSVPLSNFLFKNGGNLVFKNVAHEWNFDLSGFSNGLAYGDLDNDGDLDIVINNVDSFASIYENKTTGNFIKFKFQGPEKNKFGIGARVKLLFAEDKNVQMAENFVTRGYLSSVEPILFFGLGKEIEVKEIQITWPDGKTQVLNNIAANQTLVLDYNDIETEFELKNEIKPVFNVVNSAEIGVDFKHQENDFDDFKKQILLPHKLSQNGPFITVGDVNNDGLEDFFIGGASGQSGMLYIQNIDGTFSEKLNQPWEGDSGSEDLGCLFIDVDNDNDLDLYICSGGNEFEKGSKLLQDRLYINNGNGDFKKENNRIPTIFESTETVISVDIDNDGDKDLFVGGRLILGKYPHPASSRILINENGYFKDKTKVLAPSLLNCGLVTDATFTDFDGDGDQDLILVGEWMPITILENINGKFENRTTDYGLEKTTGMWWSITKSDVDNDGDDDYIVGNLGKNNKFKASIDKPFKVFSNDFDDNGTNDIVLAKFYKDNYVPLRGRECTSQQMPYISKKFEDYHSFASATLIDILPKDKLEGAIKKEIYSFESVLLKNEGDHFEIVALPIEAQIFPIKSSIEVDANNDGNKDVLIFGNHYPVEVETVRYDAGVGLLMLGDGKGNFESISSMESGIYVPYDSRDVDNIKLKNGKKLMIISNNNEAPSFIKY